MKFVIIKTYQPETKDTFCTVLGLKVLWVITNQTSVALLYLTAQVHALCLLWYS